MRIAEEQALKFKTQYEGKLHLPQLTEDKKKLNQELNETQTQLTELNGNLHCFHSSRSIEHNQKATKELDDAQTQLDQKEGKQFNIH